MFRDINDVLKRLSQQHYIATEEIGTVVYLAQSLQKPVLAEGPAGVGKTELAKVWAKALNRPLIRLQCYEGLDESKALYEWEYAKQMLYTQLLRDSIHEVVGSAGTLAEAAHRLAQEDDIFFSENFLLPRPLLLALTSQEPVVLLIDEIDRADAEFEAFLLEVLSDFQVSVPELGTITATHEPMVLLTSNNTRELSEALKRRCLFLYLDYPDLSTEVEIVRLKVPDLRPELAQQAVEIVHQLRNMDLRKLPSISETLDWARALVTLNAKSIDDKTLRNTLNVLLKYETDVAKAKRMMGGTSGPTGGSPRPRGTGRDK